MTGKWAVAISVIFISFIVGAAISRLVSGSQSANVPGPTATPRPCHEVVVSTFRDVLPTFFNNGYTLVRTEDGGEYNVYSTKTFYVGQRICAEDLSS